MFLYLTEQQSKVFLKGGRIIIESDTIKREVPCEIIDAVILFGNIQLSASFIRFCMKRNISISFFSIKGAYFGKIESTSSNNILRLRKQLDVTKDQEFCLSMSKKIVEAKAHNQLTIIRRYKKHANVDIGNSISKIEQQKKTIAESRTINHLLGKEGYIAKQYFTILSKLVPNEFRFKGRSRRPPRDAFNSMLSLGYTLLLHEIVGYIEAARLSPYAAFLHQDSENHPTLASDLIEEWRSVLIDSLVLNLVINKKMKKTDFVTYEDQEGVFLTEESLKKFLSEYVKKLETKQKYIGALRNETSFRKAIFHQVRSLVQAIEYEDTDLYNPIIIR